IRLIKITPSGSTIKEPCGFGDVSGCVSGRGKGVLRGLTRTCERSTPDATSCDDSKFAACVGNDQGYARSGLRVGRGLSPIRPRGVGRDSRRAGGRRTFAAFAAAKAGLRAVAQAMAREFGPLGLHVARVTIDGGIDGDRLNSRFPQRRAEKGAHGLLDIDAIAETYWQIHRQHQSAWSHEVDLRPFKELFSADYKLRRRFPLAVLLRSRMRGLRIRSIAVIGTARTTIKACPARAPTRAAPSARRSQGRKPRRRSRRFP